MALANFLLFRDLSDSTKIFSPTSRPLQEFVGAWVRVPGPSEARSQLWQAPSRPCHREVCRPRERGRVDREIQLLQCFGKEGSAEIKLRRLLRHEAQRPIIIRLI